MTNNGDWKGLYGEGWNSEIVPEAFSHPAKFSRALIRRIYQHAVENGWLKPGDCVVDPFGGVALGALDAMRQGLNWVGVELEARFVELGNKNIELWNERYAPHFPGWGSARLVQGDSRELLGVIAGVDCAISSPPYYDKIPSQASQEWHQQRASIGKNNSLGTGHYGSTPGNLGNLPAGEIDPALKSHGTFSGVVSSPPYEKAVQFGKVDVTKSQYERVKYPSVQAGYDTQTGGYNKDNPSNLGNDEGTTFWEAARVIVDQTYAALKPGGVAIWVTKAFVKNKQRVDFPGQWRRMCEAAGFVTVCEHKAWLVEDRGAQYDLFGELVEKTVERKSFFRRLAEKKGSPRIDWETVTCMRKPGATGGVVDGVVSSPPFMDERSIHGRDHSSFDIGGKNVNEYGSTPGNLGNMRSGEVDAVISSPPFMDSDMRKGGSNLLIDKSIRTGRDPNSASNRGLSIVNPYGSTPGNLGNMKGGDYEDNE